MKVFVTGASGNIGLAVTRELLQAGHQVLGLARSDASANALTAVGADVLRGTLDDLDILRQGAMMAEGVIHLAFVHDFSKIEVSDVIDVRAVETMVAALEGSGKPFVNTSGTAMLSGLKRLGTEADVAPAGTRRGPSENAALAGHGVRGSVIRLAPTVHSDGDKQGFIPGLINIARTKGVSAYVGEGANQWPAVHRSDAARLYRLAVESAPAGTYLHGAAQEGIPFRQIAEAIGRQLNIPVVSIPPTEAMSHFGWMGHFSTLDNPTSSALTRQRLGWQPTGPGLIEDLELGHYFGK